MKKRIPQWEKYLTELEGLEDLTNFFVKDRNLGTHKRVYSKKEVENILKQLIPLFNEIIGFLRDKWEESRKF